MKLPAECTCCKKNLSANDVKYLGPQENDKGELAFEVYMCNLCGTALISKDRRAKLWCFEFKYAPQPVSSPNSFKSGEVSGFTAEDARQNLIKKYKLNDLQIESLKITDTGKTWKQFIDHGDKTGWD